MKKIIVFFAVVGMIFPLIATGASASDITNADYMLLTQLGVNISEEEYSEDSVITAGRFAQMLTEAIFPDSAETEERAIEILEDMGAVANKAEYYPQTNMTFERAVKMLDVVAGYHRYPDVENAPWPDGYISVAARNELLDGVNARIGEELTIRTASKLMVNTLNAIVLEKTVYSSGYEYTTKNEITVLEQYRDIYMTEGILLSDGYTKLDEPGFYGPNKIYIGDNGFEGDARAHSRWLGYYVEAYYISNSSIDSTVLCVVPKENKNDTMTIEAELFDSVDLDALSLKYYADEDADRTKKVKLEPTLKMVYNGQALVDYTEETFDIYSGNIVLIDNDGNNAYDVAIITEYKSVLIEKIDMSNHIIHNRFKYDDEMSQISVDDEQVFVEVTKDNEVMSISDLAVGTIIDVAKSKGSQGGVVKIRMTAMPLETVVSGISMEDLELVADNTEYELSRCYEAACAEQEAWAPQIKVGGRYKLLFDYEGKIAAAKKVSGTDEFYGYLYECYRDDIDHELYYIKYMDESGDWNRNPLIEKVLFNGVKTDGENCINALKNSNGTIRQLLRIQLNSAGEVKSLQTALQSNEVNEEKFIQGLSGTNKWFASNRSMQGLVYGTEDTVYFSVPSDQSNEWGEDAYGVFQPREEDYTYVAYDMDEFNIAKAILLLYGTGDHTGIEGDELLVEKVLTSINSDDEPVTVVQGRYGEFDQVRFMSAEENTLDGVQKGDFIKLYLNSQGYISGYESVYQISQGNNYSIRNHQGNWGSAGQWDTGRLEAIDHEKGFMRVTVSEGGTEYSLRLTDNVTLYDVEGKTFKATNAQELEVGDFLVFKMAYYFVDKIVAYRF